MALKYWAYIYLSPEFDEQENVSESHSAVCRFKSVGIDFKNKERVVEIAKGLVAEGAQLIELCGGFGPLWVARVTESIGGAVPVGTVMYGPESRKPLLGI
jgi:hypothetical protein